VATCFGTIYRLFNSRKEGILGAMMWLDSVSWTIAILLCLTIGLAPYTPPHLVEKIQMLAEGRLVRPIDWFDLVLHAAPWLLLLLKGVRAAMRS
jgi:hypothetical protein